MSAPNALTSRADLLRWAGRYGKDNLQAIAFLAGYEMLSQPELKHQQIAPGIEKPDDQQCVTEPSIKVIPGKRPPEPFYYVSQRERSASQPNEVDDLAEALIPPAIRGIQPFAENDPDLQTPADALAPLPWQGIVPDARLMPFLRRTLSQPGAQRLDLLGLVKKVSRLQPLNRIPKTSKLIPAGRVVILLDLNYRMLPFWEDGHQLCQCVVLKQGRLGLDIRTLRDDPEGLHGNWFDPDRSPESWVLPMAGSVVLIVSDLGQLARDGGVVCRAWHRLGERLLQRGLRPTVVTPVAPEQRLATLDGYYHQVQWDRAAPLMVSTWKKGRGISYRKVFQQTPQKTPQQAPPQESQIVEHLLGLVAPAIHVEPELLRAVCRLLPAKVSHSGVEAAAWLHPDVHWGYTALQIKDDKRGYYLEKFSKEPPQRQRQVLGLIKQHHARQFASVWARELLMAQDVIGFPLEDIGDPAWAETFFKRFARTFYEQQGDDAMAHYTRRDQGRQSHQQLKQQQYNSTLYALANQASLQAGRCHLPDWADPAEVWAVVSKPQPPQPYLLAQQGEALYLSPPDNSPAGQLANLTLNSDCIVVDGVFQRVAPGRPIAQLSAGQNSVQLDTGRERIRISAMIKPPWVAALGWSQLGLYREIKSREGQLHRSYWHPPELGEETSLHRGVWYPEPPGGITTPGWAQAMGHDCYGIYADLVVNGILQRMRWIEAGHFLMGSPQDEPERYNNEVLHPVILSQGFWLADTTVTQALWRAVMTDNPSRFKGGNRPEQKVTWEHAQGFIDSLNKQYPDAEFRLPWEAQWEYACRAGTTTPFWFGENISPEQVNYDGHNSYNNAPKGKYRGETVEVKTLPCNAWGLYEMHGNLWEWCQDYWQEAQSAEPALDPKGPQQGDSRVVRGGSWCDYGWGVRSAIRDRDAPESRDGSGLRLSL